MKRTTIARFRRSARTGVSDTCCDRKSGLTKAESKTDAT